MTHPPLAHPTHNRFQLKLAGSIAGAVDGAWWPESRNLAIELITIMGEVHARIASVERVCYRYSDWAEAPRTVLVDGRAVKLDGYLYQEIDTVRLVGSNETLVIALVPAATDSDTAQAAMTLAMTGATTQHAHSLNIAAAQSISVTRGNCDAVTAWDSEGGHAARQSPSIPGSAR